MELYLLVVKPNTTQNRYIDEATLAPMASCTDQLPAATKFVTGHMLQENEIQNNSETTRHKKLDFAPI
jgi:hypothetical protein